MNAVYLGLIVFLSSFFAFGERFFFRNCCLYTSIWGNIEYRIYRSLINSIGCVDRNDYRGRDEL